MITLATPEIINKQEAMKRLGIGDRKMSKLLKEPDFPGFREGRNYLINWDEVWPWLMERKQKGK